MTARRITATVLLVLGGWLLSSSMMMSWFLGEEPLGMRIGMTAFSAVVALPFLLLGTWASPGRRAAELGMTLMIVAGLGVVMVISMVAVFHDAVMLRYLPPDLPKLSFDALAIANELLIAGVGYALWRWGGGGSSARSEGAGGADFGN